MPFKPGQSGNPDGRPKGARNRATVAAERLLDGEAEALSRKAIELALKGDVAALRLCLDRILPARRDRAVCFPLPNMNGTKDAVSATAAVAAAVADGDVTPSEAAELSKLIEAYTRSLQAAEFEQRIIKLEKAVESR
jgi:hypothetical protein